MTQQYIPLREKLAQGSPELHAALLRSWQIAEKEWLPAVTGNKGSFGSFPHLRNLEQYADEVSRQSEQLYDGRRQLEMTPVEIYVLLAAILFHDIGRTHTAKWHAHASRNLIRKSFADLGIEGKNLAFILADICCYHDCSQDMEDDLDLRDHSVFPYGVIHCKRIAVLLKFIDSLDVAYTRVLPHYLHGDEANIIEGFRRNTSDVRVDLRNGMVVTTIGFDRRSLDRSGQPRTCASSAEFPPAENPKTAAFLVADKPEPKWMAWEDIELLPNAEYAFSGNLPMGLRYIGQLHEAVAWALNTKGEAENAYRREGERLAEWRRGIARLETATEEQGELVIDLLSAIRSGGATYRTFCNTHKDELQRTVTKLFQKAVDSLTLPQSRDWLSLDLASKSNGPRSKEPKPFAPAETADSYIPLPDKDSEKRGDLIPYLLMRNVAFPKLDGCANILDLSRVMFLVLAGNVRCNASVLRKKLERPLAIYGIPVTAWLIEYDEHLFTCDGGETFEPSLSKDFLREVVNSMCHLSAGMFGRQPCSYRTLAAKLRVSDIELVRTAVRRIGIVSRHKHGGTQTSQACYTVQFTQRDWRWRPRKGEASSTDSREHSHKCVLDRIEELAKPDDGISDVG